MRRLLLPLALVSIAVVGGVLARRADEAARPPEFVVRAPTGPSLVTPVLSARRAPSVIAVPAAEAALAADLAIATDGLPDQTCLVVEHGERRVYELNGDLALTPASTQKLLTAGALMAGLDPGLTFATVASVTTIADGVVDGDLWIVGGGDPILATADYVAAYEEPPLATDLAALADRLVQVGLTQVRGGIRGDDTRYDATRYVEVWPDRYVEQNQTGPLSALTVNDGFAEFPSADLVRSFATATADPPAHVAATLDDLLEERGVVIDGSPGSGIAPVGLTELARIESPPLQEIVDDMVSSSDNATAELLLKELGFQVGGTGSTAAGVAALQTWVQGAVDDAAGLVVADGSGLAVENRVTCDQLEAVLDGADPTSPVVTGLAVAGQSGTLRNRYEDTPIDGRLRAKTGTLRDSTALAGFVDTPLGDTLTFVLLVNRDTIDVVSEALAWQDDVVQPLAAYPSGVDLDAIEPEPVTP